jgi:hypothetical protein
LREYPDSSAAAKADPEINFLWLDTLDDRICANDSMAQFYTIQNRLDLLAIPFREINRDIPDGSLWINQQTPTSSSIQDDALPLLADSQL